MPRFVVFLILFITALHVHATPAPFPGGVVVILFNPMGVSCLESVNATYPDATVQYWFDGNSLRQIKPDREDAAITPIQMRPRYEGLISIYHAARDVDPQEYKCSYRVEFNPAESDSIQTALARSHISVGRLKYIAGIWFWSR